MAVLTSDSFHATALAVVQNLLRQEVDRASLRSFRLGSLKAQEELERPGLFDPDGQRFVRAYEYDAVQNATTRQAERLRRAVLVGVQEGLNEDGLKDVIQRVIDDNEGRVRNIARTELNRAANWGRYTGWKRSGLVQQKEFVATDDDRVRPDHWEADGERVPVDAPFTQGAAAGYLMPPIAPNCRCTAIPVTRFTGLALPQQATTMLIPGLRAEELEHANRLAAIWARWPRILAERGADVFV